MPALPLILSFLRARWKWLLFGLLLLWALRLDALRAQYKGQAAKLVVAIQAMTDKAKETDAKWRATEQRWKINTVTITKERDNEIADIARERDAVLAELRNRPRRPAPGTAPSAADGQTGGGCTGASLYRDDAEFLIREAVRADTIRAALKACYAQYDLVTETP